MNECGHKHAYAASSRESGYVCSLPEDHEPTERHAAVARGRRWTEPVRVLPNRADRRARR